jgi:hypothetical protein
MALKTSDSKAILRHAGPEMKKATTRDLGWLQAIPGDAA